MITPNVESASRSGWMESLRCSPVAYWTGVLHVLLSCHLLCSRLWILAPLMG